MVRCSAVVRASVLLWPSGALHCKAKVLNVRFLEFEYTPSSPPHKPVIRAVLAFKPWNQNGFYVGLKPLAAEELHSTKPDCPLSHPTRVPATSR
jgi:hypothetical protein